MSPLRALREDRPMKWKVMGSASLLHSTVYRAIQIPSDSTVRSGGTTKLEERRALIAVSQREGELKEIVYNTIS
jgi:hypothetical protein